MSIVDDQIRRLDAVLDKYQLARAAQQPEAQQPEATAEAENVEATPTAASPTDTAHTAKLKSVIRILSTTSASRPLLKKRRLRDTIAEIKRPDDISISASDDESNLEWFATGKATVQVYGTILNAFLDQTIPLSESIWYWDDVLGSYTYTGLYTLQTSPIRFIQSAKEIYADAKQRYQSNISVREAAQQSTQTISQGWKEFYSLVQQSIDDRSLSQARTRILSPFALCRTEARKKQDGVKRLREQSATAIGLLVEEGLTFVGDEAEMQKGWKVTVAKSIALLEGLLTHAKSMKTTSLEFEETVIDFADTNWDEQPPQLVAKLLSILDTHLPEQELESQKLATEFGKPSRLIRYWMPALALLLSGSTLLRIFFNRREEILTWIRELGSTTMDFWYNWVVEPIKRLIGTIRHDSNSELAIMSKDSLRSDRESLERMVVDFAVQNPENGTAYTDVQISEIRSKVREGDLSAVLRAYERDIQSPAKSAIFGNLIRALLIQVQKTKVDVEVAMSGIDSILKSQELLFGMIGIAPGMLLSWLAFRWVGSAFGNRRGIRQLQEQGDTVRLLRNIDRVLSNARQTDEGMLSFTDHGLLLCEVHVLRQRAAILIPGSIQREFIEDLNDLLDVRVGVQRQLRVVERIQWAYGKWLK